jgi:hypothetical protein
MAAPLSGMSLVAVEVVWVGLDNTAILNKKQSGSFGGHPGDEGFRFFKCGTQAGQNAYRINRFGGLQRLPVGGRIMGIAADFGDKAFRCKTRRLFHSGPDYGSQSKDGFMRRYKIHNVAHLAPSGSGHGLVDGQIDRIQNIAGKSSGTSRLVD